MKVLSGFIIFLLGTFLCSVSFAERNSIGKNGDFEVDQHYDYSIERDKSGHNNSEVAIQKFRDKKEGVVCYIATFRQGTNDLSSISCVKTK